MADLNRPPRWRRMLRFLLRAMAAGLFGMIPGGLVGLVLRDQLRVIAPLIYVPLVPLGAAALVWDIAARGRGLPKWRFLLGAAGLVAIVAGVWTMTGGGAPAALDTSDAPGGTPITVLQWNVRWGGGGGGKDGKLARWDSICRDIARHAPDIAILSECPSQERLAHLERTLAPSWSTVRSEHDERARYLYRLVVASRWPVTLERESAIPSGRVMQAVVAAPGGDVRVLVVDGESHFRHDRTPRLHAVAQIMRDAEMSGAPIDLVAGDFNAVGRSVGFDAIAEAGFTSAGAIGRGWRGTWPSMLPLYDIDHVWVTNRWAITRVDPVANDATDHRGQVVRAMVRTVSGMVGRPFRSLGRKTEGGCVGCAPRSLADASSPGLATGATKEARRRGAIYSRDDRVPSVYSARDARPVTFPDD
ncbi:MAG TPA: endonuclease/exonuclease/phosphatase family protein [Tepidisphaeraceae bacterium]|nr:endonuclease/exonuclease/phosphatase family protein [Tepidisphaeraceae bacterium]